MKVVSFSLDALILEKETVVASRSIRYGEILEKYSIIVPSQNKTVVELSPNTTVYGTGGSSKWSQLWNMWVICRMLIKTQSCDVITSQDTYFLGLLGYILARTYHCGLEVQVLGIEKLSFLRKRISQFVLKRAGSIRVLSKGLRKRLIEEFGIVQNRMKLVPIYVDVSSLGFNKDALSLEEQRRLEEKNSDFQKSYGSRFNIVSVNRLVPIKNIPMQLEAMEILSREHPEALLHIVGDGPLKDDLEKEIQTRRLSEHVVLQGFKSGIDLSCFFTQSDCFVLTSDFEGYGMVVVEAATALLPVVMTNVGCAGEIIVSEESGLVVPPRDVQALIRSLKKIMDSEPLREQYAKKAAQTIAELPSFDTVLGLYKGSWEQALENKY